MKDEMKVFKIGQKVKVVKGGANASQFNMDKESNILGVYQFPIWDKLEFEIQGTVKLCDFDHDPEIFGAYLLTLQGIPVGYVYNNGLASVK